MTREQAERHLAEDERTWEMACAIERDTGERVRSDEQRRHGPPRIEVPA